MPRVPSRAAAASPTTQPARSGRPRDIWDALNTPSKPPPGGWKPANTSRTKYKSADQKAALQKCDDVVAALRKAIGEAAKTNPKLKGITARSITVDTLGDFPYVAVKKGSQPLTDRSFELNALRALLPVELRRVPMGDVSPF